MTALAGVGAAGAIHCESTLRPNPGQAPANRPEAKGYLARGRSPSVNRVLQVTLPQKGKALSAQICKASRDRNEQLLRGNTPKEVRFLNSALDSLITRARSLPEEDEAADDSDPDGEEWGLRVLLRRRAAHRAMRLSDTGLNDRGAHLRFQASAPGDDDLERSLFSLRAGVGIVRRWLRNRLEFPG